ncbi:jg6131 [Pararge aegeria aegeria]|uniref:Jg6131 protein n=1 Tax=Pararge aegeria aegeria TaxID=348720 RepID=A0A8S4RJ01_9NEOP|nr:jg6131 [Pararge aegeria aegeria]
MSVMNILWKFTAGERIQEDRLNFLLGLLSARSKAFSMAGGCLNQWPWIRFLLPELSGFTLIKQMNQQISDIIEETIARHKTKTINAEDFMYSFLEEMNEDNKKSFTAWHRSHLPSNFSFFLATSDPWAGRRLCGTPPFKGSIPKLKTTTACPYCWLCMTPGEPVVYDPDVYQAHQLLGLPR